MNNIFYPEDTLNTASYSKCFLKHYLILNNIYRIHLGLNERHLYGPYCNLKDDCNPIFEKVTGIVSRVRARSGTVLYGVVQCCRVLRSDVCRNLLSERNYTWVKHNKLLNFKKKRKMRNLLHFNVMLERFWEHSHPQRNFIRFDTPSSSKTSLFSKDKKACLIISDLRFNSCKKAST